VFPWAWGFDRLGGFLVVSHDAASVYGLRFFSFSPFLLQLRVAEGSRVSRFYETYIHCSVFLSFPPAGISFCLLIIVLLLVTGGMFLPFRLSSGVSGVQVFPFCSFRDLATSMGHGSLMFGLVEESACATLIDAGVTYLLC